MYDPATLYVPEERDSDIAWVAVDPTFAYPATIARIREVLAENLFPDELRGSSHPEADPTQAAKALRAEARKLPAEAWDLALADELPADEEQQKQRNQALEIARRWFTRAIKLQHGVPVGIHILGNSKFRLSSVG